MEWYHYVIIGAGAIIFVMLITALFSGRQKSDKKEINKQPIEPESMKPKPEPQVVEAKPESQVVEPKPAEGIAEEKPKAKEMPKMVKPTPETKVQAEPELETDKAAKYHVSQNKDPRNPNYKKWRVRKEGSNKTIKFFETQKEAIAYAEELAKSANSSVVIHKLDGSIRKQDYTKKV